MQKWNFSALSGQGYTHVLNATLYMSVVGGGGNVGALQNVSFHHIYNYPAYNISGNVWNESTATWNTRPTTASQYNLTADYTWCFKPSNQT